MKGLDALESTQVDEGYNEVSGGVRSKFDTYDYVIFTSDIENPREPFHHRHLRHVFGNKNKINEVLGKLPSIKILIQFFASCVMMFFHGIVSVQWKRF